MKIGIMLRHFEQHEGGVKVYTQNLIPRLLSLDTTSEYVLIYRNPALIGTYASYPNVTEIALSVPTKFLWDEIGIPWVVRKHGLDLVFNPKFTVPFFTRAKTVFVRHGSERYVTPDTFHSFDRWTSNLLIRLSCHSADAVICVADNVRKDLIAFTGMSPGKARVIHNGIDNSLFHVIEDRTKLDQVKEKYSLPEQFVFWAGQIDARKNIARLLRAFDKIKDAIPHNLVLAGEKGWKGEEELRPILELGLEDRVQMTGWVPHEDLPALYNLADLFAFPSLYEGFGIPLIEAMACGCPVLTANRGSPPEVVGNSAYLVDPLNTDELAHGLKELLTNASLKDALKSKGLERSKAFSWDRCAREVIALFEELCTEQHLGVGSDLAGPPPEP